MTAATAAQAAVAACESNLCVFGAMRVAIPSRSINNFMSHLTAYGMHPAHKNAGAIGKYSLSDKLSNRSVHERSNCLQKVPLKQSEGEMSQEHLRLRFWVRAGAGELATAKKCLPTETDTKISHVSKLSSLCELVISGTSGGLPNKRTKWSHSRRVPLV